MRKRQSKSLQCPLRVRIDEFLTTVGNGRVFQKQPFATGPKGGVFATVEEIAAAEDQRLLCRPRSAADTARARHRRGDSGRAAACRGDVGAVDAAVCGRMAETGRGVIVKFCPTHHGAQAPTQQSDSFVLKARAC